MKLTTSIRNILGQLYYRVPLKDREAEIYLPENLFLDFCDEMVEEVKESGLIPEGHDKQIKSENSLTLTGPYGKVSLFKANEKEIIIKIK